MGILKLNDIQREILNLFSNDIPKQQWEEVKFILSTYFSEKISDEADMLWEKNGWTEETMKQWTNEHYRRKSST
ncbi:MAG: hypothetical protein JXB49_33165 [Bacteroidales bacterium]|nr:hypothetical protein [Bacteroidales bacterium]